MVKRTLQIICFILCICTWNSVVLAHVPHDVVEDIELSPVTGVPVGYVREMKSGDTMVGELDEAGSPSRFLLNGESDEWLNRMYREFLENYSAYIERILE